MGSPISRGTIRARVRVREPLGLKTARATCSALANRCHDERESLPVHCITSRSLRPPHSRGVHGKAVTEQILDGCVTEIVVFPSDRHITASRLVILIGPTIRRKPCNSYC